MGKIVRNIILLFLVTVIISGAVIGYFWFSKKEIKISQILKAVPMDASLVFECKNTSAFIGQLQAQSNVWQLLATVPEISSFNNNLLWLDSLIKHNPRLNAVSNLGPLIISVHPTGKNSFEFLYLANFGSYINDEDLNNFLKKEIADTINIRERHYNDNIIYSVRFTGNTGTQEFFWALSSGIFILSGSSILIEDAIRQISSDYSFLNDANFNKVLGTSGKNVDANIYINSESIFSFVSTFFSVQTAKSVSKIKNIANWAEIDLNIKPEMFMFNGFFCPGDTTSNYFNIFLNQKPQPFEADKVLPGDVFAFYFTAINDYRKYISDYRKYLEDTGRLKETDLEISRINKDYGTNIESFMCDLLDNGVTLAFAAGDAGNGSVTHSGFLFINTVSNSIANEKMASLLEKIAGKKNINPESFAITCNIDAETVFNVYSFPIKQAGKIFFGEPFDKVSTGYFIIIDNYIVFGSSVNSLKKLYHSLLLKKTLENDMFYKNYTRNLDSRCNSLFYIDLSRSKEFISDFIRNDIKTVFNNNFDVFRRLDAISFQLTASRGMVYNSTIIKYNPEVKEKTHTIWESRLDSTISIKPVFLINHVTDEKEIFVQDDGHNIYLINSSGRILWKRNVSGKIISEIYQVDAYKNKKLQYLFNTKDYIYIIDRNGNHLDRFPVKLPAQASNGVCIRDFDSKGDVLVFVACSDKKIYCYTLDGNISKNWEFDKTDNYVYSPFLFFKIKETDYIVFADTLKCYITGRKGNEKIKVSNYFPKNPKSRLWFEPKTKETDERIVTSSANGTIYYIYMDGSVKTISFAEFSPAHFLEFRDMDIDGYNDYIFLDGNELSCYTRTKKKLFSYEFSETPVSRPVFYEFPGGRHKIGVVCRNENKIYLVNLDGKLPRGFPLTGSTMFSIGHFDTSNRNYNLITGNKEGFLLNYEVY